MSRPFPSRNSSSSASFFRVNGKIRAREVRVIGVDGKQLGVIPLNEALSMARSAGVDLVEIASTASPPVCRLVDFGKFRYEQAKKEKESKKHQHASTVKEIQLSPRIDPHDLSIKVTHAVDFLCEDMKVKIALRFRGREMQHTEFGFQVINKFLQEIAPFGHPDFQPKLMGRSINVMVSPLPRNKRAKNPNAHQGDDAAKTASGVAHGHGQHSAKPVHSPEAQTEPAGFANNPFAKIDIASRQEAAGE